LARFGPAEVAERFVVFDNFRFAGTIVADGEIVAANA
jgi:hypothetical protein